ncbi:isocitrate lyase-family enzyme [Pseudonocardia sulfidoxydans NBRC 16205]|uniref:2-methylisocitrate lyase n=1 Tax=Pseudonocardia sulfidoxydans NBRC 16205 TaxID=1223511 RepID=A0A511DFA0_9PSEU|nr:oxaloacetate decarboxylase [Pseudonocardia sulfidoxydans]GEL22404.1 isocitrate lyase-family enzyme [Pseudonocardia sulfidoxydans NBRC 16205]
MNRLNGTKQPRSRLRELLTGPRPLVAPGAYDALSALLVEQAGFDAVFMSGFAASASLLGKPDIGLLTGSEMTDNARRIADAVDLPLIVDGDTGYGNALNVARTVRLYEQAGASAIQLEDQVLPKRCGHMAGKQVIPCPEMLGKIRAAVDARSDPDFLIIARTDSAAVEGVDAAIQRAHAFADAGADLLFVEAPESVEEINRVAKALSGDAPLVFNWAEGGRTPPLTLDELATIGFSLVYFPISTLLSATAGMRRALRELKEQGTPATLLAELPAFDEFTSIVGLPEIRSLETRYV